MINFSRINLLNWRCLYLFDMLYTFAFSWGGGGGKSLFFSEKEKVRVSKEKVRSCFFNGGNINFKVLPILWKKSIFKVDCVRHHFKHSVTFTWPAWNFQPTENSNTFWGDGWWSQWSGTKLFVTNHFKFPKSKHFNVLFCIRRSLNAIEVL